MVRRGGRDSAREQGSQKADRTARFEISIEVRLDGDPLEHAGDEGEHRARYEFHVEMDRKHPPGLCLVEQFAEPLERRRVILAGDLGDPRVTSGLGPDLDDQQRLFARRGEDVFLYRQDQRLDDVGAADQGHEFRGAPVVVVEAEAFDQSLLGGEVSIEVAGAHAGFVRYVLHGGGVKPEAHEGALRGLDDARVAFAVPAHPAVRQNFGYEAHRS